MQHDTRTYRDAVWQLAAALSIKQRPFQVCQMLAYRVSVERLRGPVAEIG